jgi:uncharacterized protein
MRFWDSSGILPLIVAEKSSPEILSAYADDPEIAVWWNTQVECASAIARLEREGLLTPEARNAALDRLDHLLSSCQEVLPAPTVRVVARRLLLVHPLRAADALQLAAALVLTGQNPSRLTFVCLDFRLSAAASREGFHVLGF